MFEPVCYKCSVNASLCNVIPTLPVMTNDLDELSASNSNETKPSLCEPLVYVSKKGIQTRFGDVISEYSAQLIAVINPASTLDCVQDPLEKFRLDGEKLKVRAVELTVDS